jgi:hypothetical protein
MPSYQAQRLQMQIAGIEGQAILLLSHPRPRNRPELECYIPLSTEGIADPFPGGPRSRPALSEVVSALASHHIEFKRAALMIYALQVASSNAKIPADLIALQQVRDASENEEGEELAPEITTYEPDDEEYEEANREPSLADLLLAEVRRHREEDQAKQAGETPKVPENSPLDNPNWP